jgi:hypothetical protein
MTNVESENEVTKQIKTMPCTEPENKVINQISRLMYNLFFEKIIRPEEKIEEDLNELVKLVTENYSLAVELIKKIITGSLIFSLIDENDLESLKELSMVYSNYYSENVFCDNYAKLLRKFPQMSSNDDFKKEHLEHFILSAPPVLVKEFFPMILSEVNKDLEKYIIKLMHLSAYWNTFKMVLNHTDYPLIKIIYELMCEIDMFCLEKFIAWTKSNDCIRVVELKCEGFILSDLQNFVKKYYDYPEYYTEFEIQDKDICFFDPKLPEIFVKFFELCEKKCLIVSREKIERDFINHGIFSSYKEFCTILCIYRKYGFLFDIFDKKNEQLIFDTIQADLYFLKIQNLQFFERIDGFFFAIDKVLDLNEHFLFNLSINKINYLVSCFKKPINFTPIFLKAVGDLTKNLEKSNRLEILNHLIKLYDQQKIILCMNEIFCKSYPKKSETDKIFNDTDEYLSEIYYLYKDEIETN